MTKGGVYSGRRVTREESASDCSGEAVGAPSWRHISKELHSPAKNLIGCHHSSGGDGRFGSVVAQQRPKPHGALSIYGILRPRHPEGKGHLISRVAQPTPLLAGVFSLVGRDPLRDDVAHPGRNPSQVDLERSDGVASSSKVVRDLEYSYSCLLERDDPQLPTYLQGLPEF
ncbi:hypothetical protein VTN77DRAFT_8271 [Rasamsonia byssochlamydoides]|uniref:uncharacterized protein n=1 Tax=Rasamsonia byssochlamydoides TaxID=89139 RepID=UPI003743380A